MLNNASTNISFLDESIRPLVNQILSYDQFGVFKKGIHINSVSTSHNKILNDQFTLPIPYANKKFKCDVIFDLHNLQLGPDFIFEDVSFFCDPTSHEIVKNIPSLAEWDERNPNALLNVVKELLNCYKLHQLQICEHMGGRLTFEYDTLVSMTKPEDVEVSVTKDKNKMEANFYIYLDLDFSSLPHRQVQKFNDMAILVITFQGHSWKHRYPRLELTENLRETLHTYNEFKLPTIDEQMALMDYVDEVKKMLQERINLLSTWFHYKKDFISLFKVYQPETVIEYDSTDFSFISLLIEHEKLYCIVKFKLPDKFPHEPPEITLHSIYHLSLFHPVATIHVKDFKYNQSWTVEEIATNLLSHLVNNELNKSTDTPKIFLLKH